MKVKSLPMEPKLRKCCRIQKKSVSDGCRMIQKKEKYCVLGRRNEWAGGVQFGILPLQYVRGYVQKLLKPQLLRRLFPESVFLLCDRMPPSAKLFPRALLLLLLCVCHKRSAWGTECLSMRWRQPITQGMFSNERAKIRSCLQFYFSLVINY